MDANQGIALAGVISTATIAIINAIISPINEHFKRKAEKQTNKEKDITESSIKLLNYLTYFLNWEFDDFKIIGQLKYNTKEDLSVPMFYADLKTAELTWELLINPLLNIQEQERVKNIRERLINVHISNDLTKSPEKSDVPILVSEIIELTNIALNKK